MPQDAIALLEADHERVETLFRNFQTADAQAKVDMAQVICMELTLHAMVEEELFYPAFAEATGDQELLQDALEDHQEVKDLIAQVPQGGNLDQLVAEIMENTLEHVEEERREMFPKAKSSGMDLVALAEQIERRRAEVAAAVQEA